MSGDAEVVNDPTRRDAARQSDPVQVNLKSPSVLVDGCRSTLARNGIPPAITNDIENERVLVLLSELSNPSQSVEVRVQVTDSLNGLLGTVDGPAIQLVAMCILANREQPALSRYLAAVILQATTFEYAAKHLVSWVCGKHPEGSPIHIHKVGADPEAFKLDAATREFAAIALRGTNNSDVVTTLSSLLNPPVYEVSLSGTQVSSDAELARRFAAQALLYIANPAALDAISQCLESCTRGLTYQPNLIIIELIAKPYNAIEARPQHTGIEEGFRRLAVAAIPNSIHGAVTGFLKLKQFPPTDENLRKILEHITKIELQGFLQDLAAAAANRPRIII